MHGCTRGVINYVMLMHLCLYHLYYMYLFLILVLYLGYMDESGQVVGESPDKVMTGEHVCIL